LVTYSQQEKGWPKQEDYNCPRCDFIFIFSDGPIKKAHHRRKKIELWWGRRGVIHMANQYNKTHEYKPKNNKR